CASNNDVVIRVGIPEKRICGAMRFSGIPTLITTSLLEAQAEALAEEIASATHLKDLANRPDVQTLVGLTTALFTMASQSITVSASDVTSAGAADYGWVAAGAYFMRLTVGMTNSLSAYNQSLPVYYGPTLPNIPDSRTGNVKGDLLGKIKWHFDRSKTMFDTLLSRSAVNIAPFATGLAGGLMSDHGRSMINMLFMLIDTALALTGAWDYGPVAKLAVWIGSDVNPLAAFIAFGIAWVQGCLELIGWAWRCRAGPAALRKLCSMASPC
ncbi:MAG: hypothetical protein EB121_07600, partial [Alphaproteobacteria bacterium]|nr:hypothetical protein [Alphaproteobacteria bacterium]